MLMKFSDKLKGLSRKEREKLFKKNEILSAAVRLFAQKGYERTTLDEIASAAEFGKGTIYNYFNSKEDIFLAIMEEITENYFNQLKVNYDSTTSLKELVRKMSLAIFNFYAKNTEEFVLMHRIRNLTISFNPVEKSEKLKANFDNIKDLYTKRISSAIESKEIKRISIDSLQLLMQSMFFGYLHQLHVCKKLTEVDIETEVSFIVDVLFSGIENK